MRVAGPAQSQTYHAKSRFQAHHNRISTEFTGSHWTCEERCKHKQCPRVGAVVLISVKP